MHWLPDATQIAYRKITWKGWNERYSLYGMPANGGASVLLTGDIDAACYKYTIAWVTNLRGVP